MADQTDAVAFFQGKGEVGEKRPKCRFNMQRLRVSNVLIVNLLKSYRHANASSNIADDNPVSPREGN
jgi:hypothetical protein